MKPRTPPPTTEGKTHVRTSSEPEHSNSLALTLDLEIYLGQLDDWNISEEQKIEFIISLWNLFLNFAELGFAIHPVQQAMKQGRKPSGNSSESSEKPGICAVDLLYSDDNNRTQIKPHSNGSEPLSGKDSVTMEAPL